ncbi:MAG: peptide chain release factor-like protein [Deltaproteobacteria bacterium]|nr:peptide chain release factor-like protein [Deltaproteobacteria bacterium]
MEQAISQAKWNALKKRMQDLGLSEDDLTEEFIKGTGSGGQKINKTNSCVQISHAASGIVVKSQKSRSRAANRFFARRLLIEKLEEQVLGKESAKAKKIFKLKAQKRKRKKRAQEKVLAQKKLVGEKKDRRKKVSPQD